MDFMCAAGWKLGLVGFLFLFGVVIGSSFITKLGDKYGRRIVYAAGLFANAFFVTVMVFSHLAILTGLCLFALGMSITARYYVGYTYNVEWQLKKHKIIVSVI